jgi:hypothetical protein
MDNSLALFFEIYVGESWFNLVHGHYFITSTV